MLGNVLNKVPGQEEKAQPQQSPCDLTNCIEMAKHPNHPAHHSHIWTWTFLIPVLPTPTASVLGKTLIITSATLPQSPCLQTDFIQLFILLAEWLPQIAKLTMFHPNILISSGSSSQYETPRHFQEVHKSDLLHNNSKALLTLFIVLTFALMGQKPWWVK